MKETRRWLSLILSIWLSSGPYSGCPCKLVTSVKFLFVVCFSDCYLWRLCSLLHIWGINLLGTWSTEQRSHPVLYTRHADICVCSTFTRTSSKFSWQNKMKYLKLISSSFLIFFCSEFFAVQHITLIHLQPPTERWTQKSGSIFAHLVPSFQSQRGFLNGFQ